MIPCSPVRVRLAVVGNDGVLGMTILLRRGAAAPSPHVLGRRRCGHLSVRVRALYVRMIHVRIIRVGDAAGVLTHSAAPCDGRHQGVATTSPLPWHRYMD
jgi:hypothetical protein